MRSSTRLVVNTGAQYIRTIINVILSFYSTRLILTALGVDDYGIFTLIAGVVSMLAFMTNAMVSTTQRFMSYHQAKSDLTTQQQIFGNSVLMHLIFSVVVLIILEAIGLFLFDGFLNISPDRIQAARVIYQCAIFMVLLSFITAPYKALLISHENLIYVSIVDVFDGILKVLIAFLLLRTNSDKLVTYGYLMFGIYMLNFLAFVFYDIRYYKECVCPKLRYLNKQYLKSMGAFVGWQLYSTGCIIGRTQGTAIVLNKFFSTAINTSFGIALQVSGAISFLSSSLMLAITPQIVKAEGVGERDKTFLLAATASKFSFFLLSIIAVPIFFFIHPLLQIWLGEVPESAVLFCRVVLLTALFDQITLGLGTANSAIGDIRDYSLAVNTIKILTVPILITLLLLKCQLDFAIWSYAIVELICALIRIPFLKKNGGLNVHLFIERVFSKIPLPTFFLIISYYLLNYIAFNPYSHVIAGMVISVIYLLIIYIFSLNESEKYVIHQLLNKLTKGF